MSYYKRKGIQGKNPSKKIAAAWGGIQYKHKNNGVENNKRLPIIRRILRIVYFICIQNTNNAI